ncbi:putative transposase [Bradyrhizobium sp. Rc3b]|nr:putative transposase [Bradyrhizobium sp. Rc3b]
MKFVFIAKHRAIWPVAWLCDSGFHAWLNGSPSARSRSDEELGGKVKASFMGSDRTYGARRDWCDLLADGADCGLHQIERLLQRFAGAAATPALAEQQRPWRRTSLTGSSLAERPNQK